MRIGINLFPFMPGVSGGIEYYIRNLLASLARIDTENQYYLFTNLDNRHTFEMREANFSRICVGTRVRPQVQRIMWEQFYLPIAAQRFRLDVLHSPSYTWPVLARVPGVVTICDMLYRVYPEYVGQPKLAFWRLFVPWSAHRCKRILTISEHSRKDIIRYLSVAPEKVVVTTLDVDRQIAGLGPPSNQGLTQVCEKYGIKRPYILSVGGVGRHKNSGCIVRSLAFLHQRSCSRALNLVITGNDYGAKREIESTVIHLGLSDHVFLPGYVTREDLRKLYAGAAVYASPSYFEGFGLTLLEAMTFGVPVVISDRSSLPEVANDAALVVDPDNPHELADAIYQLVSNSRLKDEMIGRGFLRVKDFSWERTAMLTLEAYRKAKIDHQ